MHAAAPAYQSEAKASPSSLTPRSEARSKAQVIATYVVTFVAGACAAAVPLLSLLKQVAEHKGELAAVLELVQRVGWPAVISGAAIAWMALERKAWRKDRADFRAEMAEERRAARAEIEAVAAQVGGAVRENTVVMRALLQRLGARPGDTTGQHGRIPPVVERQRKQTGSVPLTEEAASE